MDEVKITGIYGTLELNGEPLGNEEEERAVGVFQMTVEALQNACSFRCSDCGDLWSIPRDQARYVAKWVLFGSPETMVYQPNQVSLEGR